MTPNNAGAPWNLAAVDRLIVDLQISYPTDDAEIRAAPARSALLESRRNSGVYSPRGDLVQCAQARV
jgi:hypothetical protein